MQNGTSAVAAAHFAMFYCTKQPGKLYLVAFVYSLPVSTYPTKVSYTPKRFDAPGRATCDAQPFINSLPFSALPTTGSQSR